ncbi:hypothetical protein [Planctomicrobium piriforme]|uniref:Antitoxin of type II TA system, VapB n=1 Tax=Planctomicrobium piriforme TaxID=1576369 RepID=A0A1I3LZX3_9PLAN|nr:hypothetical protein [Planctomicrobium piriforme]SFI90272.1 hypothetical protein SAMN05421753_113118 [Planctomicrobium piriforme]
MVVQINLTPEELNRLKTFTHVENEADALAHAAREFLKVAMLRSHLGSLEFGLGRRRGEEAAGSDPHLQYP